MIREWAPAPESPSVAEIPLAERGERQVATRKGSTRAAGSPSDRPPTLKAEPTGELDVVYEHLHRCVSAINMLNGRLMRLEGRPAEPDYQPDWRVWGPWDDDEPEEEEAERVTGRTTSTGSLGLPLGQGICATPGDNLVRIEAEGEAECPNCHQRWEICQTCGNLDCLEHFDTAAVSTCDECGRELGGDDAEQWW